MEKMKKTLQTEQFFMMGEKEIKKYFKTEPFPNGLDDKEVQERLNKYGPNRLRAEQTPKWKLFARQFNNMIIYILIVAALLTLYMGHYSDAVIIGLVVVINAYIGYYQEANASDSLEKIKSMLSVNATAIREGHRIDIPAEELVPGDLVYLEAGDHVPADLRIIDSDNLRVEESSLTGEADSVHKRAIEISNQATPLAERLNMAYASTAVTNGSGTGIVVATAEQTEIGKISEEVNKVAASKTPLMREIDRLGKNLSLVIIFVAVGLFFFGMWLDIYSLSVLALAIVTMIVGSIPEGLPATTSVILAMGVSDMSKKKNTIVKSLPAVETLGAVDIIATDKTGTLTKNEMTVQDIFTRNHDYTVTGTGYAPYGKLLKAGQNADMAQDQDLFWLLTSGYEANDTELFEEEGRWTINGEPTDGSFLTLYHKAFGKKQISAFHEIDRIPFDSDYRYIAKLAQAENGKRYIFVKGSPDKLFQMAEQRNPEFSAIWWQNRIDKLTKQGKRVVAVGYKEVPGNQRTVNHEDLFDGIEFLGMAGIIDPPRTEVIEALKQMRRSGVQVKMITGDHPMTAKAIGQQLGLADEIKTITGPELDKLSKEDLAKTVPDYQVFARTTPENKLDIVQAFQANNKVTAMTGDGVNDAPALKKAEIGVAMGIKGTDVAKDSADMILADDNFATMSVAIKEGRRIYENIKKSILFLLPTSFAEGLIIAFTIIAQREMPLQATQLLWINMVSAITIQFAFIFEPAEDGIMRRPPRKTGSGLMDRHDIFQMTYVSVLMAVISMWSYDWLLIQGADQMTASTMMINIIIFSKIFYLFNIRTSSLALSKDFFSNKKAFLIIGIMIVLQMILIYVPFMQTAFQTEPLTLLEWGIAAVAGIAILLIAELDKWIRLRLWQRSEALNP
ncbi:HAD-IC family P-type ATPase [Sporolactobacillus shoreicorticis]|uniref:HAD-IC family P-type ATPase n=1 Tax=Sporolactobacillus shoreicorticis TaxID=1923877 RepID=A0ABW5S1P7_9BACL|nr:HAD-IC family P-type ATPase [Sporolactobacillus shoreicorticis]MCO7127874.1 HAD-IC family P-type ATPase [Sporolactobacillus shoreicorticis]